MKHRPTILSTQRFCLGEESSTLSTPKLEISWKELSVLLKPVDSQTARSSKSSSDSRGRISTSASSCRNSFWQNGESHSSVCENHRDQDRCTTTSATLARKMVSSPSTPIDPRRSLSRTPSFSSPSGRIARMEQAEAARKLLDLISPVIVASQANPDPDRRPKVEDSPPHMRTPHRRQGPPIFNNRSPLKSPAYGSSAKRSSALALMTPPRHPNSARKASQGRSHNSMRRLNS